MEVPYFFPSFFLSFFLFFFFFSTRFSRALTPRPDGPNILIDRHEGYF